MKQLITKLLMLTAVLSASINIYAYDFEVDGIYYDIISSSEKTVVVTDGGYIFYSGNVVIPEQVSYNNDTYSVTTIGDYAFQMCSGLTSVTIPNSVTTIGDHAFSYCSNLKELVIEDGEKILHLGYNYYSSSFSGEGLFYDCPLETVYLGRNLSYDSYYHSGYSPFYGTPITTLTISDSVTTIGNYAFKDCIGLTSVTMGNSVTTIGNSAFSGCSGLEAVNISDLSVWCKIYFETSTSNPLYRAHNLYLNGELLTELTIPDDITEIKNSAFSGCSGLTSVTIPNSVTSIGESAFENCSGLTSLTIPDNVLSVGSSAFANSGIKELIIEYGEETISIQGNAFDSCPIANLDLDRNLSNFAFTQGMQDLKNLTISDNVTSLGSYAFFGCESLVTVMIPNSVTSIGQSAFNSCESLSSVTIGVGVLLIGKSAFEKTDLTKTVWLPNTPPEGYEYVSSKRNYVANESYTELNNQTVYPYLSSLFETGGLKYVPVSPSERTCDAIDCSYNNTAENIVIGKTVNYKGIEMTLLDVKDYACYDNDSIKTLQIKEYTGNIGGRSFSGCDNLATVNINDMIGNIGESSFSGCDNLNTVDIQNLEGNIGESSFSGCDNLATVNINDMIGNIGGSSFYSCGNLETVNISEMKGSIGYGAFLYCNSLKGIEIPNTVTAIGERCFAGCSSLEYATIGSGISSLPESCFRGCSSLPEITIPATVKSVGNNMFYGCGSLTRVDIADRQSELSLGYNSDYSSSDQKPLFSDCPLDSVYVGGNISYATDSYSGYSPFYRNTSLRAVKITDQETEISENEFYGCTGLTTVELGDGIESIGNYAFSGCSALDSFSFGHSVATIGEEAFSDCTAMTSLQSRAEMPPVCGNQALDDINKWTCELFVPTKSLDAYKAAEQWKEFFFITGEDFDNTSGVDNVLENGGVSVTTYRDCIEIIGAHNAVITVYNTNGQIVYSGTETTVGGLAQGIYIVCVGGQTFKVAL